jgi:excisionase family DNA binding protein
LNEDIIPLISHKKNELEWRLKGEMFRRFGSEVTIAVRSGYPGWVYLTLSMRASRNREMVAGRWAAAKSFTIDPDDRMISLKEAAELTDVNNKRIKKAIRDRELKVYAFGPGTKRLLLSDLHRWWERHRIKAVVIGPDGIARINVMQNGKRF